MRVSFLSRDYAALIFTIFRSHYVYKRNDFKSGKMVAAFAHVCNPFFLTHLILQVKKTCFYFLDVLVGLNADLSTSDVRFDLKMAKSLSLWRWSCYISFCLKFQGE